VKARSGASPVRLRTTFLDAFRSLDGPNAVIVEANVNADLSADMQILVNPQTTMVAENLIL